MWAPRDFNLVKAVKSRGSDIHNQPNLTVKWTPSRVFLKDVWEQVQVAASVEKTYWEAFLSKITFFN